MYCTSELKGKNSFYDWVYDLNENGEIYCGINDGKNGKFKSIYAQNNENYGNCIRYRESKVGYIWNWSSIAEAHIWKIDSSVGEEINYKENNLTISQEDAITMADTFVKEAGLDGYIMYKCEKEKSAEDLRYGGDETLDNIYMVTYTRNIDGAFIMPNASKYQEGWQGDTYVKRSWPVEQIAVQVADDGIIGMDYTAPIDIVDTVVEKSTLKTFDEIRGIFENMVLAMYADEQSQKEINVTDVRLGYATVSEEGTFDTGLLVPVWDFIGSIKEYDRTEEASIMTINAIDGTVIDRTLGY